MEDAFPCTPLQEGLQQTFRRFGCTIRLHASTNCSSYATHGLYFIDNIGWGRGGRVFRAWIIRRLVRESIRESTRKLIREFIRESIPGLIRELIRELSPDLVLTLICVIFIPLFKAPDYFLTICTRTDWKVKLRNNTKVATSIDVRIITGPGINPATCALHYLISSHFV